MPPPKRGISRFGIVDTRAMRVAALSCIYVGDKSARAIKALSVISVDGPSAGWKIVTSARCSDRLPRSKAWAGMTASIVWRKSGMVLA